MLFHRVPQLLAPAWEASLTPALVPLAPPPATLAQLPFQTCNFNLSITAFVFNRRMADCHKTSYPHNLYNLTVPGSQDLRTNREGGNKKPP